MLNEVSGGEPGSQVVAVAIPKSRIGECPDRAQRAALVVAVADGDRALVVQRAGRSVEVRDVLEERLLAIDVAHPGREPLLLVALVDLEAARHVALHEAATLHDFLARPHELAHRQVEAVQELPGDRVPVDAAKQHQVACVVIRPDLLRGTDVHVVQRVRRTDVPVELEKSVQVRESVQVHIVRCVWIGVRHRRAILQRQCRGDDRDVLLRRESPVVAGVGVLADGRGGLVALRPVPEAGELPEQVVVAALLFLSQLGPTRQNGRFATVFSVAKNLAYASRRSPGGTTGAFLFSQDEIDGELTPSASARSLWVIRFPASPASRNARSRRARRWDGSSAAATTITSFSRTSVQLPKPGSYPRQVSLPARVAGRAPTDTSASGTARPTFVPFAAQASFGSLSRRLAALTLKSLGISSTSAEV